MDLYLVRGLPNSGKSTLAKTLAPVANFAADDYFDQKAKELGITYSEAFERFRNGIHIAHETCQNNVMTAMLDKVPAIAVANTFTTVKELTPYLKLASELGYKVHVLTVERYHNGDNGHNVPDEAIERMALRWQHIDKRFR